MRASLLLLLVAACCAASLSNRAEEFFSNVGRRYEDLKRRASSQWGNPGKAGVWGRTLFVPGHSLDAHSWKRMIKYGATNPSNGPFAAVFDAKTGSWHRGSVRGETLTATDLRRLQMFIVNFSDRFGSTPKKAAEIGDCVQSLLKHVHSSSNGPLPINIVTHSAGDADFDLALVEDFVTSKMIEIRNRIAIGPVFDGTYVGSLGGGVLGHLGRFGRRMGAQAAQELAEESALIERLKGKQNELNLGIYKRTERVDILVNGIGPLTPRLDQDSWAAGDGFVQSGRHRPFVSKTFVVDAVDPTALNHLLQVGFKAVLQKVNQVLVNE